MNFIIQENVTLDVEHPISFGQDIPSNLDTLLTKNYCNKFIGKRFYVRVVEIVDYTDIFIQTNNSGSGSITCIVKFLCIVYAPNTLIFDLDITGSEMNKNVTVYKCTSNRYPRITFMTPSQEKYSGTIPMGNIISIGINKASENIIIFDIVKQIGPVLLPFDFSDELSKSKINNELLNNLNSGSFNKLFTSTLKKSDNGDFYAYERGVIYKASKGLSGIYQNLTNIADRESCWDLLEKIIYNFIHY